MKALSKKQADFVKAITKGHNQTESAKLAGYSITNAGSIATRLMNSESIKRALHRHGLTDDYIAMTIKKQIDSGSGIKATADTSLRGLAMVTEILGYKQAENSSNTTNNTYIKELNMLSDDQLQAKLLDLEGNNNVKQ